jgi:hypothetical protein
MYFDYLHGRVMKIGLNTDDLEERLYDRDNGQGAAERALASLLLRVPAAEERPTRRADDDDSAFIASMAIPSVMAEPDSAPVAEPFTGGGGEFSGAGASSPGTAAPVPTAAADRTAVRTAAPRARAATAAAAIGLVLQQQGLAFP